MLAGKAQRRGGTLLLAAILAALGGPAYADFKRSYAKGLDAAKAEKWGEVQSLMQEALAEEQTPQTRVRLYGTRFEPYVPQYYLGLAAYRTGNCASAVKAWDDPATKAVVAGIDAIKKVADAGLSECKVKLAGSSATTTPVASTTPAATTPPKPATPTPTPPTATPTTTPPTATTTVASTTPPKPAAPAPAPPPKPTPAPAAAAAAAPEALVAAIDAFINGRYQQVVGVDPASFGSDTRARYHALLVRAAARHTQYLTGEAGQAALAQAQADVRTAKGLFPTQSPDSALFSPRFRQFYSSTR